MRDAETLLEAVAQFLGEHGLPQTLTFDNDPRFVGSALGRDFPSALVRFLWCVGVIPNVIPPHRPDFCCVRREISSLECLGSACRCIGQGRSRRSLSSLRHTFLTTTVSGPTRRAPVATNRRVWPARPSRGCLLFPSRSILIDG
jgi:hypothetical protein